MADTKFIVGTGYIPRSEHKIFADVGAAATPDWELQGDRNDELSTELSPNVESGEDVTGRTYADLDKYEEQTSVETYRAQRDSKFAVILYDIYKYRKTLSNAVRKFCVVNQFAGESGKFDAWVQDAVVAVQSIGGDTKGMNMPYNIHWTGARTYGTFDLDALTFTPEGSTPDPAMLNTKTK